ncbi:MAG: hypothetical protein GY940_36670, partial [bacterium]|nr:hypothetical protein [bacterium]
MGRRRRQWVSQKVGSFHIISRTTGADILFFDQEKEYFMNLLERLAAGFFVQIHAFAVLGNHFHILATGLELDAQNASEDELCRRYRLIYGKDADPPVGSYDPDGTLNPDPDGGTERLRRRLGSISRFVQELKQTFSTWYNKEHDRKGYLWSDRFKGVIVSKGEAQLACSAYIDLNPVRANLAQVPEDYRWCSLGLWVRNPGRAKKLLHPIPPVTPDPCMDSRVPQVSGPPPPRYHGQDILTWYREFVYLSGGIERDGKRAIPAELINQVRKYHGRMGIG